VSIEIGISNACDEMVGKALIQNSERDYRPMPAATPKPVNGLFPALPAPPWFVLPYMQSDLKTEWRQLANLNRITYPDHAVTRATTKSKSLSEADDAT
jgi:hypothetical protein